MPHTDADALPPRSAYPWFLTSSSLWLAGMSLQGFLFTWLLVGVLERPADEAGFARSLAELPPLAVLFLGGLWIDWQTPGQVVIDFLVFTDEPYSNSGLFIGAIIVMIIGFVISRTADSIEEFRKEEVEDQTQEWMVDVGNQD